MHIETEARPEVKTQLQKVVDAGRLAGAVTLAWRNGETQIACAGLRDIEANLPVERDTLFRIASMTKPITSVATLMLADEGRITLADPIVSLCPGVLAHEGFAVPQRRPRRNRPRGTSDYV